jgi:hypothetical protein
MPGTYILRMFTHETNFQVLEPKPRKFSPGGVPAFAMGLSTSSVLQPVKAETLTPATVVPAATTATKSTTDPTPSKNRSNNEIKSAASVSVRNFILQSSVTCII